MRLHLDFETRSRLDLKKVGAHKYAAHPSTDIICLGYALDDRPREVLTRDEVRRGLFPLPVTDFRREIIFVAHNAPFERAIWRHVMARYGYPIAVLDDNEWSCTMARAYACGLPGELGDLAVALRLPMTKDLMGRKMMLELSTPRADGTWDEDPEKLRRTMSYCGDDVDVERLADKALPDLIPQEKVVMRRNWLKNERGLRIDKTLARTMAGLTDAIVDDLNARLRTLTQGYVDKATQVEALKRWLAAQGVNVASLDKVAVTDLLARTDIKPEVREVITLRRQVAKKNSIAKYGAALEVAGEGDRARGLSQYHGAHTGRSAGRLLQPLNFPKGFKAKEQQMALAALRDEAILPGAFVGTYGVGAMEAASDLLRGLFIAGEGKTFVCADFNAIEARVLFWLADEVEALAAYRRGESPYVATARKIYGNPNITKEGNPVEYDIGKRSVLGAGYSMGWEKFRDNVYIETAKMGKPVRLADELAQRCIKSYREQYARVVQTWYAMEAAAINAVRNPGSVQSTCGGRVLWGMTQDRRFLACRLPSGRFLRYYKPEIRMLPTPWGEEKPTLCYWGQEVQGWTLLKTYGGLVVENVTQAVARDIMVEAEARVEDAGFEMLLDVYDELVAEATPERTLEEFLRLMTQVPAWAAGCPIAAEGWVGERYHK